MRLLIASYPSLSISRGVANSARMESRQPCRLGGSLTGNDRASRARVAPDAALRLAVLFHRYATPTAGQLNCPRNGLSWGVLALSDQGS